MGLDGGKRPNRAFSTSADVLEDLAASGVKIASVGMAASGKVEVHLCTRESILPTTDAFIHHFRWLRQHWQIIIRPKRAEYPDSLEGRQIRTAFIAAPGLLISADYSQIELRLVAHVSGEFTMIEAFHAGIDIHARPH